MKWNTIIFDLDGVICCTDHYHYLAWKMLAEELKIDFNDSVNDRLRGISRMQSLEIILGDRSSQFSETEKAQLAEQKNAFYRAMLQNMTPDDLPQEVHSTLLALKRRKCQMAIGSSSKNAHFILQRIGLDDFFVAVVDGTQITRSKPNPEVFLRAAVLLNAQPKDCLVVEDAEAGIQAAKAGGFAAAALGPAQFSQQADYRLTEFSQLLSVI